MPRDGEWRHPYAVLLPLLREGALSMGDLVTHTFPLAAHDAAFAAAFGRARSAAIKVAFAPDGTAS